MIRHILKIVFLIFLLSNTHSLLCQSTVQINGIVKDDNGNRLSQVSIRMEDSQNGTLSNDSGYYQLNIPSNKALTLVYSYLGFQTQKINLQIKSGEIRTVNIILLLEIKRIEEVYITNDEDRTSSTKRISTKDFKQIPNPSGNFESLLKSLPGVSSTNELSSQYSVRGGNFDENLVYVNDIEVLRPFLIRTGQQEGLSFINPDMVSAVKFSAGGFEARYGDKMSSVLDVSYKKPTEYQTNASASLLGGTLTFEGISKNKKLSHITGFRYKTSKYLLSTLDTKGSYIPAFIDLQSQVNYQISKKMDISFLGNFAQNKYNFTPETRSTNFGTMQQVYNLMIYYDGHEVDKYQSALGAVTLNFKPKSNLSLKLIISANSSNEQETFDIDGAYRINDLDNVSESNAGRDSILNIGVGQMLDHARNYLNINVFSISHIGMYSILQNQFRWSMEYKQETIDDKLNEWSYIDSANYSVPHSPTSIVLEDYANSSNYLINYRLQGYLQDSYQFSSGKTTYFLNGGIRFNYWSFNKELLVSPRFRFSVKPAWSRDIVLFVATGLYFQPAFYKEMRDLHGIINYNIKAQQSYHIVAGSDYNLQIWERPFKFTSEVYYKYMDNLIPYIIDNIRTRYSAKNNAVGYAEGIDMKLNGEFVPGIESWASLSIMKTEEKRDETYTDAQNNVIKPGYYLRPTNQLVNFSLFFQDYLPNNPTFQLHLNLAYGSDLPLTGPNSKYFDKTFPIGPYRRVDVGISKIIKSETVQNNTSFFKPLKEFIISLDIFNMLNIANKASYLWVRTVSNQENMPNEFAVPNYLTSRRLNLKLSVRF